MLQVVGEQSRQAATILLLKMAQAYAGGIDAVCQRKLDAALLDKVVYLGEHACKRYRAVHQTLVDGTAEDSGERGIRPHDIGPGPLRCGHQLAIEVGWRVFNVYPHISKIHIKQPMTPRPWRHNPGDGRAPRACPTGAMAAGQPTHWHTATCRRGAETPCKTARMALSNGPHEAAKRPIRPCRTARATWRHANCKGTKKACPMKGQAQTIIKKQLQSASNLRNDAQLGAFDKRGNHADGLAIGHLLLYLQYGIKHRRLPVEHKSVGICNVLLCLCV